MLVLLQPVCAMLPYLLDVQLLLPHLPHAKHSRYSIVSSASASTSYIIWHPGGHGNRAVTLFKSKSKFMSVEINTGAIRMFMKVGGRDPWSRVRGSLNDISTAWVSLLYLHNRY